MEKPTRWQILINSLKYGFVPFKFVKVIRIKTSNNKIYEGKDAEDFKNIIENIKHSDPEEIVTDITFEPQNRKIKKEVRKFSEPLFNKYFPTKD